LLHQVGFLFSPVASHSSFPLGLASAGFFVAGFAPTLGRILWVLVENVAAGTNAQPLAGLTAGAKPAGSID